MNSFDLLVAGRGAFAEVFVDKIEAVAHADHGVQVTPTSWNAALPSVKKIDAVDSKRSVVLHVGSGRELPELIDYCQKHRAPLIQASTSCNPDPPQDLGFCWIDAPNLAIPILKLFRLLEAHPQLYRDNQIKIIESHQATKTSVPGTAVKFAELLGADKNQIISIRDPKKQSTDLQVPAEHLGGHAIHQISIQGDGVEIHLETRIFGRDSYLHGVAKICKIRDQLKPGRFFITDLIESGLL